MTLLRLSKVYMQRRVVGKVLLCALLSCFLYLLDCWPDWVQTVKSYIPGVDAYYFVNYVSRYGSYKKFAYALCAYPFAANFCEEWASRNTYYVCARSSKKQYVLSNFLICAFAGGFVAGLAQMIFLSALSFFTPLWDGYSASSPFVRNAYFDLLCSGHTLGYYACSVYHSFLAGALWATVGMSVSIWYPVNSVAIVSPVLVYYIYTQACTFAHIARPYRLDYMLSIHAETNSLLFGLLFPLGIVAALFALQVFLFYRRLLWRLNHEAPN